MSLGDYLRLQRARLGGITPWDIEAATELPKGLYRQMEQRYRAIGDENSVRILADFYKVPYEDLTWRLEWSRKALSRALQVALENQGPFTLHTWDGGSVTGQVRWWDLGSAAVETTEGLLIVQRHAVERWDPRLETEYTGADLEDPAETAPGDATDE